MISASPGRSGTPIYIWLLTLVNLGLILFAIILFWRPATPSDMVAVTAPRPSQAPFRQEEAELDLDALNPYGQAVARAGLLKCALPMNALSERLLVGKRVGIYRFPVLRENFASFSMEVAAKDGAILYMAFDLSQNADGACQIAYEAVSDWANSCEDVVKTIFKDFVPTRNLLKAVAVLSHKDDKNRKIFTMPVQNGCIAIEKETISTHG